MHKQQSYVLATSQSCQPQEEKQSWQEDAPLQEEAALKAPGSRWIRTTPRNTFLLKTKNNLSLFGLDILFGFPLLVMRNMELYSNPLHSYRTFL